VTRQHRWLPGPAFLLALAQTHSGQVLTAFKVYLLRQKAASISFDRALQNGGAGRRFSAASPEQDPKKLQAF